MGAYSRRGEIGEFATCFNSRGARGLGNQHFKLNIQLAKDTDLYLRSHGQASWDFDAGKVCCHKRE